MARHATVIIPALFSSSRVLASLCTLRCSRATAGLAVVRRLPAAS